MSATAPDLTPPTKGKTANKGETKPAKEAKPKVEKAPKEPKAPRARGSYGYDVNATIELVQDKETKYRGQRLEWFEIVKTFAGKKVSEFNEAAKGRVNGKGTVQTPSGWLRFYVIDGSVRLVPPAASAAPAPTEPAAPASA